MKQMRFLGFLPAFCLLAFATAVHADGECPRALELGSASGEFGEVVAIAVTIDSDSDVQGVVMAADWSAAVATGVSLDAGAALTDPEAEVVAIRIENDYFVLGVVVDTDGQGPDSIPAGADVDIATLSLLCGAGDGGGAVSSAIEFRNSTYAAVDGGPALDNIMVIGGLSIGMSDALCLQGGEVRCTPPPDRLTAADGGNAADGSAACGNASVLMTNNQPVEGFVVALCLRGTGLTLDSVALGAAAAAADFFEVEEDAALGFAAGVVIDLLDPFVADFAIPVGSNQEILSVSYCCPERATTSPPEDHALDLCDGELGEPLKDNILVIEGQSIGVSDDLRLDDGVFTCSYLQVEPPGETEFHCSARDGGDLSASAGAEVEVCFGILVAEDDAVGHAQPDHIQGFSMAVTFCNDLTCQESLDISGTILEALGAEFVSLQCDNDSGDGDGKELIIGVLIDALPPFDGATIAPGPDVQPIGYITFDVSSDAECGSVCPIEFVDGINGVGRVPIKNLVSAENKSRSPAALHHCGVEILGEPHFFRGDCNFSLGGSMAVDIADAAAVVSHLFLPGSWNFQPGCLDACDCNDDGRVDLADSICILQYLFQGGRTPPSPGTGWDPENQEETGVGPDPTDDKLGCPDGQACELIGD
jgi:hypothetical protein